MASPLEGLQSLGKRWENILACQCFLSSLPFPVRVCFPLLVRKTAVWPVHSCLTRNSCECCFLLPVQIYLLHPQLHTSPAGDARPGSDDICISVISVKACEEQQNLAPWVLWWIPLASAVGFILSLVQTHAWNLSTLLPSTLWLRLSLEKLTSSILLISQCTFICIDLLLEWYQKLMSTTHLAHAVKHFHFTIVTVERSVGVRQSKVWEPFSSLDAKEGTLHQWQLFWRCAATSLW